MRLTNPTQALWCFSWPNSDSVLVLPRARGRTVSSPLFGRRRRRRGSRAPCRCDDGPCRPPQSASRRAQSSPWRPGCGQSASSRIRPRGWRGAIVSSKSKIIIKNLDSKKRPVSAVADNTEIRNATLIKISVNQSIGFKLLYNKKFGLQERNLAEQFKF